MKVLDLFEHVNDHVLYHLMGFAKAEAVMTHDTMEARWTHRIDGREVSGNSMTRNALFTFDAGPKFRYVGSYPVRLTLDARRLRQRHKVIPLDAEIVHRNTHRPGSFVKPDRHNSTDPDVQFAEEFVVGTIQELHRYVTRVEVPRLVHCSSTAYNALTAVKQWCDKFGIELVVDPKTKERVRALEDEWAEDDTHVGPLFP